MSNNGDHSADLNSVMMANSTQRTQYFVEQINQYQQIWILTDDDGAVMLTTEDDDCIPVWPNKQAADFWRNDEWQKCDAIAISLEDWKARWTSGMQEDDLSIAVFPIPGEDGLVVFPDEFEQLLAGRFTQ
jgi:hypothetical protein